MNGPRKVKNTVTINGDEKFEVELLMQTFEVANGPKVGRTTDQWIEHYRPSTGVFPRYPRSCHDLFVVYDLGEDELPHWHVFCKNTNTYRFFGVGPAFDRDSPEKNPGMPKELEARFAEVTAEIRRVTFENAEKRRKERMASFVLRCKTEEPKTTFNYRSDEETDSESSQ